MEPSNYIAPECGCSVYTSGDYLKINHCRPYTQSQLDAALLAERERCARLAETSIPGHYACGIAAAAIRKESGD